MGLFRISKELQFKVYNHGEPRASLHKARKEECFYREEKEVRRAIVNKEPLPGGRKEEKVGRAIVNKEPLPGGRRKKKVFLLPVGHSYYHRVGELLLLVSRLYLILDFINFFTGVSFLRAPIPFMRTPIS